MIQGDSPQDQIQALRSVNRGIPPNSIPPASPDEIYHVDTQLDPDTQKAFIFWDDIIQAFDNAVQVRHKTRVIPFLRGKDQSFLEPRRITTIPDIVLDVVVDSPRVRELELQLVPPQDGTMIKVETISQIITPASSATSSSSVAPNITSSSSIPSTANSAVRRSPVYGLVEEAMEVYTHIDRPLALPSARGPHTALDDLLAPSYPIRDDEAQQRAPQSPITSLSVEMKWARAIIDASYGDKDAQVALGDMYKDGKGVAQDYQAAMDWYLKAAEQGDAAGQQRVGTLHDDGFGVPQNYSIAMSWYLKAANQGHASSQHSMGALYNHGHGVSQDYSEAMKWYLKAAEGGHPGSQYRIGQFYYFGQGVLQDHKQAMEWYLKAAQQGHASAQHSIGLLYYYGQGVSQDYAQELDRFLKAANQGSAFAPISIGFLYYRGQGVPQDFAQAMDWYLKSAKQGNDAAQHNIGVLHKNGQGVPQDYAKAAEWFSKAADRGHKGAKGALEALKENAVVVS